MAIRVTIRDVVFDCDTAAEAREVAGFAGNSEQPAVVPPMRHRGRPANGNGHARRSDRETRAREISLLFLRALSAAGKKGVGSEDLVPILKLGAARASGGALRNVTKVVAALSMPTDRVFVRGGVLGQRRWHAGPDIEVAINKLEGGESA